MKQFYSFIFALLIPLIAFTQVGINNANPDASAVLDITADNKGFLPPRLTSLQRDEITSPSIGLLIYNKSTNCLNVFIETGWNEICGTTGQIASIDCASANVSGVITEDEPADNVFLEINYSGGNGGSFNEQTITSSGVVGLTAILTTGNFANGNGSLTFTIVGTATTAGLATFMTYIGGQSCSFEVNIEEFIPVYPEGSIFCASGAAEIVEVLNPITNKIWMDRNLGATQVAVSSTDENAYGDLYQWGRRSDGHQCRNSSTITTLSSVDQPSHGDFIVSPNFPNDWRSPQNTSLWQGVNGINNPCPSGFRIPTSVELNGERLSWSSNNGAGAFSSPLKLTLAGDRVGATGALTNSSTLGFYYSSVVSGTNSVYLIFNNTSAGFGAYHRADGASIRCIKN